MGSIKNYTNCQNPLVHHDSGKKVIPKKFMPLQVVSLWICLLIRKKVPFDTKYIQHIDSKIFSKNLFLAKNLAFAWENLTDFQAHLPPLVSLFKIYSQRRNIYTKFASIRFFVRQQKIVSKFTILNLLCYHPNKV